VTRPEYAHEPVLVEPILRLLDPRPGQVFLDGTVGLGGHAAVLAPRLTPGGRYIGLDVDDDILAEARRRLCGIDDPAVSLVHASYAEFPGVLAGLGIELVDHMLLDLGVNSAQLADEQRGFSFDRDGPLDMRMDRSQTLTATELVNGLSERALSDLFFDLSQEPASRRIAKEIYRRRRDRRITTTRMLAQAVEAVLGPGRPGRIHPATRVFQALRIAVNGEIDNLRRFLSRACDHLRPGGRLAVIGFHSVEDGEVKRFLREQAREDRLRILTKKPLGADAEEVRRNPRSRSAKLRVAERI
jgi:16S rRNA (cytosine1402-N4)-methyltransferase